MRQFVQELLVLGDFSTFILNGWGREKKMRRKVKLLNKIMNTEDIYSTNGQDQRKSWECKMERKKKKKKKHRTRAQKIKTGRKAEERPDEKGL